MAINVQPGQRTAGIIKDLLKKYRFSEDEQKKLRELQTKAWIAGSLSRKDWERLQTIRRLGMLIKDEFVTKSASSVAKHK